MIYQKFCAKFHDLCVQKRSCLLIISDAFWEFSACKVYKEISGRTFTIYMSKNEAVVREVQTHFGSSLPASFAEKVMGAFPRFMRPNAKLFPVKFRRILEVFALPGL